MAIHMCPSPECAASNHGAFVVNLYGAMLDVPRELLIDIHPMTDDERAEYAARRAREKAEAETFLESLQAECDPVMRQVLDLHAPDGPHPECLGCDVDGYDGAQPVWPCRTVQLLADVANVDIPAHMT